MNSSNQKFDAKFTKSFLNSTKDKLELQKRILEKNISLQE
jgi:hypothetical protein